MAYVALEGRHLIGDPNFLRIDKTTIKYHIKKITDQMMCSESSDDESTERPKGCDYLANF